MACRCWFIFLLMLGGCKPAGPATTHTASSAFSSVVERVTFLNHYVTFRRTYETLDFDVMFQNNGGGMTPAPSDFDVRLVATVPASEIASWIPQGSVSSEQKKDWLNSVPTQVDLASLNEWYGDGHRIVGVDRSHRIVAYRAWSH